MNVLVINCSATIAKYQVLDTVSGRILGQGEERSGNEKTESSHEILQELLAEIDVSDIDAVGHRVVHGGNEFYDSVVIDDDVIRAIERSDEFAPLHNPANLAGIRAAKGFFPDLVHVAVFDTSFHSRMPRKPCQLATLELYTKPHIASLLNKISVY